MADDKSRDNQALKEMNPANCKEQPIHTKQTKLEEAREAAAQVGLSADFLDPNFHAPELIGVAQNLLPAIEIWVKQGNQQGKRFFKQLVVANPDYRFTEDEEKSIIDRCNWEAGRMRRRPKMGKKTAVTATEVPPENTPSPPLAHAAEKEKFSGREALESVLEHDVAQVPDFGENVDIDVADPSKYGDDPEPISDRFAPSMPDKPIFIWRRDDEETANAFFRSIYRNSPIKEIVAAAEALINEPEALAKVRARGEKERAYLDETFRKLGMV